MAEYRSGFEDDGRRGGYPTELGARSEGRYATGYGYGPTYGGTTGGYGTTTGNQGASSGGYGTTGGYGGPSGAIGTTTRGDSGGFGTTTGHQGTTTGGYGTTTGGYGGTAGGYGGYAPETPYGQTSRFGHTQIGVGFGTTRQQAGTNFRGENTSERQYPDYTQHAQHTQGWTGSQESRFAEPGRSGVGQTVTRLQDFGAYGQGATPRERRRFGTREYGPY